MRSVHGVSPSPFVRKVRIALAEKQLPYELVPVMPFGVSEDFRRISPLGKVPVYEEDGRIVNDSTVICAYLERTHPEPALYPADAYAFARALWFEEFGDTALAQAVGGVFIQKIVGPTFLNQPTDQAALDRILAEDVPRAFDYLEREVAGAAPLVGSSFSIADIGIATHFVNFAHAGHAVDAARWPKLAAYVSHHHARPSFAAVIAEERSLFASSSR